MTEEELYNFAERKTVGHVLEALDECIKVSSPGAAHALSLFAEAMKANYKLPTIQ